MNDLKKIELHLHLDGSLDLNDIKKRYGLSDSEIKEKMVVSDNCQSLNDYLSKFDFPIRILQTREELETAITSILEKQKKDNVIYTEIRFAPQLHTHKGLTQEEVVKTLLEAKAKVDVKSNLILCLMRGSDNDLENYETLNLAKKYLNKGVCAIDLAGNEGLYKTSNYKEIFALAKKNNIPFTIHAGEADGTSSIKDAISFGAKRIGHGVRSIEDDQLLDFIIKNNITLEVCPTSNIQTGIYDSYSNHPIEKLYKKGVKVTINTDNMTVSNTTLANEYSSIINNTNLTKEDIINMNTNSIKAAFISEDLKSELMSEIMLNS